MGPLFSAGEVSISHASNSNPRIHLTAPVRLSRFIIATTKSNYILENKTIITSPSRHTPVREIQLPELETAKPADPMADSANRKTPGTASTPADTNNLS